MDSEIVINCNKEIPTLTIAHVELKEAIKAMMILEMCIKEKLNLTTEELELLKVDALVNIAKQLCAPVALHGEKR